MNSHRAEEPHVSESKINQKGQDDGKAKFGNESLKENEKKYNCSQKDIEMVGRKQ